MCRLKAILRRGKYVARMHYRWMGLICATATALAVGVMAPAVSARSHTAPTVCTGVLAPGTYPGITVPTSQSCTMGAGVIVTANVMVSSGASLTDTGASVGQSVHAVGAASVTVSGGSVSQNVQVNGTSGAVSITNTTIGNDLIVDGGAGAVTVSGNTVTKNVNVTGNSPGGATVNSNAVSGKCSQSQNSPYAGSGNTGPNVSSCNGSGTPPGLTTCTGTLASGTYQAVTVPSGHTCTMGVGVIVLNNVTVSSGASLTDTGASIVNNVHATGAAAVTISGGAVNHDVHVGGASGAVSITNTSIGDDLSVQGDAGAVVVSGNNVSNNVSITNNSPGGATVNNNAVAGKCSQSLNNPYSGSGNTGPDVSSCNGIGTSPGLTSCTGTLVAGTYKNVAVPSGQSCTMGAGVIIANNLTVSSGASLTDTGASIGQNVHATGAASVTISGGTVLNDVRVGGTSGAVSITNTTIGDDLNIDGGAGAVTVSGNTCHEEREHHEQLTRRGHGDDQQPSRGRAARARTTPIRGRATRDRTSPRATAVGPPRGSPTARAPWPRARIRACRCRRDTPAPWAWVSSSPRASRCPAVPALSTPVPRSSTTSMRWERPPSPSAAGPSTTTPP